MRFLGFLMIGVAVVCFVVGLSEKKLAAGASERPEAFALARIEAEGLPENPHLDIGPHWRLYGELVFSYRDTGQDPQALPDSTLLMVSYYPVLSPEHPAAREILQLERLYGGLEQIPAERIPVVDEFSMLVKTRRYGRYGDLPTVSWLEAASQSGMVVNRISSVGREERELLEQSFPSVDMRKVAILEDARTPASARTAMAWLVAGGIGVLLGIGAIVLGQRQSVKATRERSERDGTTRWIGDRLRLASCHGIDASACWICGELNDREPSPRDYYYTPPLYALGLLLGLLPGLILMVAGRRRVSLAIPVCDPCESSRRRGEILANCFAVFGLIALPTLLAILWAQVNPGNAYWGALIGFVGWVVGVYVLKKKVDQRQATCERIEAGEATLRFPRPELTRPLVRMAA